MSDENSPPDEDDSGFVPVTRYGLKTELYELLQYATAVSAVSEDRGMARLQIENMPYDGCWRLTVDWSDASFVDAVSEDPVDLVTDMRAKLAAMHAELLPLHKARRAAEADGSSAN
jgi:hypothetical protein